MTRAQRTNATNRGRIARASAALALAALFGSACGSDDSSGDSKGKCSQGDTRACLGPGACNGAQSCAANGQWSACDCGGATGGSGGASGGTGGSSGSAGGGGLGGTNTGGAAGDASPDGAGGGTQWKDDPCPSTTPLIDCSNSCGGPSATCAQATCTEYYILDTKYPAYPYVIRTPSKPGVDPKCAAACPGSGVVFGIGLAQAISIKPNKGLKVTAPNPWKVVLNPPGFPDDRFCTLNLASSGCVVIADNAATVLVLADTPDAPAVNVILEEVPWPATCP